MLLKWPELGEMEEDRMSRLRRADVWIKEMHMEKEYESGVGAGEEGSILIIWQCYLETSPIGYAPICKVSPCRHVVSGL